MPIVIAVFSVLPDLFGANQRNQCKHGNRCQRVQKVGCDGTQQSHQQRSSRKRKPGFATEAAGHNFHDQVGSQTNQKGSEGCEHGEPTP